MTQQVTEALEALSLRRRGPHAVRLRLGRVLQLLRRDGQGPACSEPAQRPTAQRVLAHALDALLRLLHPMMPFITEEVWQLLAQGGARAADSSEPSANASLEGEQCRRAFASRRGRRRRVAPGCDDRAQFADFQAVLGAVREVRQAQNIAPRRRSVHRPLRRGHRQAARADAAVFHANGPARHAWGPNATPPDVAASRTLAGQRGPIEVHVDVSRFIDVGAERKRLEKEREDLTKQIASIDGKLANKAFVDKRPPRCRAQRRQTGEYEVNSISRVGVGEACEINQFLLPFPFLPRREWRSRRTFSSNGCSPRLVTRRELPTVLLRDRLSQHDIRCSLACFISDHPLTT